MGKQTITSYVQTGTMVILPGERCIEIKETGQRWHYDNITPIEWGTVYEKYVGQIIQSHGYTVTYNMSKGFLDGGIDVIAENNNHKLFIQCKSSNGSMGKQKIEWILYKAGETLNRECKINKSKHICFVLVTPDKDASFKSNSKKHKNYFNEQIKYPWLDHFLAANNNKQGVKVFYREIPFIR